MYICKYVKVYRVPVQGATAAACGQVVAWLTHGDGPGRFRGMEALGLLEMPGVLVVQEGPGAGAAGGAQDGPGVAAAPAVQVPVYVYTLCTRCTRCTRRTGAYMRLSRQQLPRHAGVQTMPWPAAMLRRRRRHRGGTGDDTEAARAMTQRRAV